MDGFEETFDQAVAGSGAGSKASALPMRRAGKSVLILETTSCIGGVNPGVGATNGPSLTSGYVAANQAASLGNPLG
jgi:phytoene dehydrogenase-like protein